MDDTLTKAKLEFIKEYARYEATKLKLEITFAAELKANYANYVAAYEKYLRTKNGNQPNKNTCPKG